MADMLPFFLSFLGFGFICFCVGVRMGANYTCERIAKEFDLK
jgi:hypothetical protein